MHDALGRNIDYARISITDRCNLRCVYCMPESGIAKVKHCDILSFEQIAIVCQALADLGVTRLKITGGEPLVRKSVPVLVDKLKNIAGIDSVTLTSNGILLPALAADLKNAGLDSVNISLDALNPAAYRRLTRGGEVADALRGIDAALDAGFMAVKINCVPFADSAVQDLLHIVELARARPLHIRFIELMPLGYGAMYKPMRRETLEAMLASAYGALRAAAAPPGNGPAQYYAIPGFCGSIGFIETLTHSICNCCNRLRLTADGVLKTCLHMDAGVSLKAILQRNDQTALRDAISEAIRRKPAHHNFGQENAAGAENRSMSQIGG